MEWSLKFTCRGDVLRCWGVQWDPKTRILCGSEPHITESNKGDAHEPYRILLNESLQYVSMYIYVYIKHPDFPLSLYIYIYIYIYVGCILYISTLYNIYIIIIYPILYMSYSWITKSTWPGRPPSTPCPAPAVLGWAAPGSAPNYYGSCAGSHRCNRLHINKAITSYPATIYIYILIYT
jgi:hypothetical protein